MQESVLLQNVDRGNDVIALGKDIVESIDYGVSNAFKNKNKSNNRKEKL
jgi:hypothetical protein